MLIHPVYLDGPLEGKDYPVEHTMYEVKAYANDFEIPEPIATYRIVQMGFHYDGVPCVIWLASVHGVTTQAVVKHVLSDYARKAMAIPKE